MTQRRGQCSHVAHIASNIFQTLLRQLQAVVEWIGLVHLGQVLAVGFQDAFFLTDDGIGNGLQNLIPLFVAQHGQALAGLLYSLKNLFHFAMVILVLDEAHRYIIIRALASSNTLFSMFSWV